MGMAFSSFAPFLRQLSDGSLAGNGYPGATPPFAPPVTAPPVAPVQARPGFDDVGGLGDSLRTLAAHLMMAGGQSEQGQAFLAPVVARQQEQRMFARQANQQTLEYQRQAALRQQEQQWKLDHPEPTELQRQYDWIKSTQGEKAAADFIAAKTTAPPIVQHNEDGTLSVFPAGMVPRTAPQPAPTGVTFTPLPSKGGAAPQARAPFPIR